MKQCASSSCVRTAEDCHTKDPTVSATPDGLGLNSGLTVSQVKEALPDVASNMKTLIVKEEKILEVTEFIVTGLREGKSVLISAIGALPVNSAVMAMCLAREQLLEGLKLELYFHTQHNDEMDLSQISQLDFMLGTRELCFVKDMSTELIRVTQSGRDQLLGARIASIVHSEKQPVLRAIGPYAVGRAVVGTIWSQKLLKRNGMDVICCPRLKNIDLRNQGVMAVVESHCHPVPSQSRGQKDVHMERGL